MERPLPLTHASPEIALVGYKEEATGRYTKDNYWRFNEHITEFREIKTDAGKLEGES